MQNARVLALGGKGALRLANRSVLQETKAFTQENLMDLLRLRICWINLSCDCCTPDAEIRDKCPNPVSISEELFSLK